MQIKRDKAYIRRLQHAIENARHWMAAGKFVTKAGAVVDIAVRRTNSRRR